MSACGEFPNLKLAPNTLSPFVDGVREDPRYPWPGSHGRKSYKVQLISPLFSSNRATSTADSLHQVFAMLFHKSLVSLVIAFAAASSASASITPVARCGDHACDEPPSPSSTSECNTQNIKCCNGYTDPSTGVAKYFSGGLIPIDAIIPIDALLDCTEVVGASDW
jgi:hypothetical protein